MTYAGRSWEYMLIICPVIAGSPLEPMTRSIAVDLERRGFIVYVLVQSVEEEHIIQTENRSDVRALYLDLTTVGFMYGTLLLIANA